MEEIRILSPTALLGYGFPEASLKQGLARDPHVIAVDGGSTDGGPYYLGFEPGLVSGRGEALGTFIKRDLGLLLEAAVGAQIPLLLGSAGFAGGDVHVAGTVLVAHTEAQQRGLRFRLATISAELQPAYVLERIRQGRVHPLGPVPELTEADVTQSVRIVAQMGVEPFIAALEQGAEVVIAGRANDPSMFAALPLMHGFDPGLALHLAKILECGAIAADPGSGSDVLLGTLRRDHFLVEAMSPDRRCTVASVAAHSLYEKSDPTRFRGPGGEVDLTRVRYEQLDARTVRVSGSTFVPRPHQLKIEGARRVGFRTIAVAGMRDPAAIRAIDALLERVQHEARKRFAELQTGAAQLGFHVYGRDGVMGRLEPLRAQTGHELGLVFEAMAPTQGLATAIVGFARSSLLHMGFEGRISTAGNLAFPFSPQDLPAGPVYAFSAYHLIDEPDPLALFPIYCTEVGP